MSDIIVLPTEVSPFSPVDWRNSVGGTTDLHEYIDDEIINYTYPYDNTDYGTSIYNVPIVYNDTFNLDVTFNSSYSGDVTGTQYLVNFVCLSTGELNLQYKGLSIYDGAATLLYVESDNEDIITTPYTFFSIPIILTVTPEEFTTRYLSLFFENPHVDEEFQLTIYSLNLVRLDAVTPTNKYSPFLMKLIGLQ